MLIYQERLAEITHVYPLLSEVEKGIDDEH